MVCQCNVYVIPESIRRKGLGYKGYEPATPAPARTADHSIRTCRKFKSDMLDNARTFLKPVRPPRSFVAVLDFGDLPSDSDPSGDSDFLPDGGCEVLN